jgi:signal transduction histidine kinase
MKKKLTWSFIAIATGMVILASGIFLIEMHVHLSMFQQKFPQSDMNQFYYDYHFEQALIQSTLWTAVGTMLLAVCVSLYIAKKIASPLLEMKHAAEQMSQGNWESRVKIKGNDELADLGNTLNLLTSQLQEQEIWRKNLTSDIAHELRTPLATLKSYMEAFRDGVWQPTDVRIQSCQEEIERLIHIVGDLEQLTNVESPGFSLRCKQENLVEIVQQVSLAWETKFYQKNVQLHVQTSEPLLVWVDRNRVLQIIINLLSNALSFTPSGGKVVIAVEKIKNKAKLVIEDTGAGIPSAEIKRVFERFYRVDKSRSRELGGSGIGLTIVQKLVEAHDGSIQLESVVGEGTKVILLFPIYQESAIGG